MNHVALQFNKSNRYTVDHW